MSKTLYKIKSLFVLVFFLLFVIVDLEVSELIRVLGGGNDTEPVPQIVLLQVFLGQILQIPLAEGNSGSENDLVLFTAKSHILAKVAGFARDLKSNTYGSPGKRVLRFISLTLIRSLR